MIKIGLVARADNSGLGTQTYEFYRHMQPAKTMVVDISRLNGNKIYPERYPDAKFIRGIPLPRDIDAFLGGLDVVFIAEAPYNYYLYERARELGVKTSVQYNYEFFDWFAHPHYPKPDMLIAPSRWHFEDVQAWCNEHEVEHIYLHCPVNRVLLPRRAITKARTFLHVVGRSAAFDRNGTETVIDASKYLKTPAFIEIHFQGEQGLGHQATATVADYIGRLYKQGNPNRVTIQQIDFDSYQNVYKESDVLLLPRRYGGNCLPMNEALSLGMPVVMTDISPNKEFLPSEWLIPAERIGEFTPRTTVDIYGSDPRELAAKIDEFYSMSEKEMRKQNDLADYLAETIAWHNMKEYYDKVLRELCNL